MALAYVAAQDAQILFERRRLYRGRRLHAIEFVVYGYDPALEIIWAVGEESVYLFVEVKIIGVYRKGVVARYHVGVPYGPVRHGKAAVHPGHAPAVLYVYAPGAALDEHPVALRGQASYVEFVVVRAIGTLYRV